jgi:hypothetical protein
MDASEFCRTAAQLGLSSLLLGLISSLGVNTSTASISLVAPYYPSQSPKVSDVKFSKAKQPHYCPVTAFEAPGQAWRAGLTSGGVTFKADTRYANKTIKPIFSEIDLMIPSPGSNSTAIIVADHFTPLQLKFDEDDSGPEPIVNDLFLTHGSLVIAHMRALLESAGYNYYSSDPLTLKRNSSYIRIYPLDVGDPGLSSKEIKATSTSLLQGGLERFFEEMPYNAKNVIINMSFALLPCDILTNYREVRDTWYRLNPPRRYTLNNYFKALLSVNPALNEADIVDIVTKVPDSVPFKKWFDTNVPKFRKQANVLLVASSSNFGLDFSTAPAIWNEVISVGAVDKNWQPVKDVEYWSSRSDIRTVGEWFTLSDTQIKGFCKDGGTCIADDVKPGASIKPRYSHFAYRGTSFSAPSVTAFLATLNPNSPCFKNAGPQGYKPLINSKGKDLLFRGHLTSSTCP